MFYPNDWPGNISQLASYGEQQIKLLINHFKRVLPSECSIEIVLEEWTEFKARIYHINNDFRMIDQTTFDEFVFQNRSAFQYISALLEIFLVMPGARVFVSVGIQH